MTRSPRHAFTLVELLVVITIIGILMGLLIPAVNAARESARRNQCSVNMKNLALAAIQYENTKGRLPPSVARFGYFGAGPDPSDPGNYGGAVPAHMKVGGFGVSILPWLEAQPTYEHWTEDRYPIVSDGNGDLDSSTGVGASSSGEGFHELAGPNLEIFQCPSNPNVDADQGRNSYVSNNGLSHMVADSSGFTIMPNTGSASNAVVPFAEVQDKDNVTSVLGYAGEGHPYLTEGPKVTLDGLKDGQGFTALYSENVQALPWYLPGLVNAPAMANVVNSGSAANPDWHWNATNATVATALLTAPFTAGMVWHMEDNDFQGNPHSFGNGFATTILPVEPKHRINGRGNTVAEDIFTEQMSASNYADLARPTAAHVEGVNMGFADGATRFVQESVDYRVYQALMTPRGKSSDVPWPEFVLTDEISL